METKKIKEALADLRSQRELVDNAVRSLEALLLRLNGTQQEDLPFLSGLTQSRDGKPIPYVDAAVEILQVYGRPLHVKEIWRQIKALRGDQSIKRQAVEGTLLRHIAMKGEQAKIRKIAPATYTLPKRKEEEGEKRQVASLKPSSFD